MSKIQEALRRMQDAQQRQSSTESTSSDDSQKLATITTKTISPEDVAPDGSSAPATNPPGDQELALVNRSALRAGGLIAPEHDERKLDDEYRQIKRPLIANAFGKRASKVDSGQLIMVASALPGDGKTFTCINLALSLAQEKDYEVILVDADVPKPHISEMFDLQEHDGLLDLIERPDLKLENVIVRTDVPRLSLLASGKPRNQTTELLASGRMEDILRGLLENHPSRIVLFDSPPLLITSESQVLAGLMGQLVVVVKAGVTPQHAVEEAIATLDPGKAINLVLNQARRSGRSGDWGGHYYGYGSKYGSGSGQSAEKGNKTRE